MSRVIKLTGSMGAAALILSGSVMAAAPDHDAWSVTNGVIDTDGTGLDCPEGYTCAPATTGLGFFQREMTNNVANSGDFGKTYFQTIITNEDATSPTILGATQSENLNDLQFADESFVSKDGDEGLSDKQRMKESEPVYEVEGDPLSALLGNETFDSSATIQTGFAGNTVAIGQTVGDTTGLGFTTDFAYALETNPADGTPTGMSLRVTGVVGVSLTEDQTFTLSQLNGTYNAAPGGVDIGVAPIGGTMNWAAGQDIKAVHVGQDLTIEGQAQAFGFTSFVNADTGTKVSSSDLLDSAAEGWDTTVWGAIAQ